ncbi:hypothetical protein MesoLjLc_47160 [Mesorhizobium sp. L-8-10]|uniref:hypothetical protein n=1 Tax=Mesorhizobium sp. L-8-10 TaxID=2744523 RepID=UPI0019266C44|nr:hypothetical protein [Mesorhizobium sp. L-8-10]BCH32786.1 hypothetical protein MesoLjLc_47160 [Mesorhizobium sp. L-8-10]
MRQGERSGQGGPSRRLAAMLLATLILPGSAVAQQPGSNSPVGTYLWYPEPGGPKSDQDCRDLVARVQPTREKAEMSLWGTIPQNDPAAGSFFLLLSPTRMEPTYAAEGDYDFGDVRLGETRDGETPFELTPDDHEDVVIKGTVIAKPGGEIVTVILRGIPLDGDTTNRTTYFCRFEDLGTET